MTRDETVLRLSRVIASTLDLDTCLREIAQAATSLMHVSYASIWLVDELAKVLHVGACSDARGADFTHPRRLALGEGGVGWVAAHGRALAVDDVFVDTRLAGLDWWRAHGLRSFYGVPVVADGTLVAVLALNGRVPILIDGEERAVVEGFAALAAVAIRNARLFTDERTARAVAEAALVALRESEARHQTLVDGAPLGVHLHQDGVIKFANEALARMQGYAGPAELVGQPYAVLFAPHERERLEALRLARLRGLPTPSHLEIDRVKKDGSPLRVESWVTVVTWEGAPAILVTSTDISERVALETRLRRAQKMDAMGRLAAGVAHDFSNRLTLIYGCTERLQATLHGTGPVGQDIAQLWQAAGQAAHLVRQLLAFSRRQTLPPRAINLNDVIDSVTGLLRRVIGEDIEIVTRLDPALGMVLGDAGQVEQVLMNLAVNARDAMPDGGRLVIATDNIDAVPSFATRHAGARSGRYARLAVTDTGCGMSEATLANVFDPFFTTKEPGKGTGLGLAIVHGVVEQHDGWIEVNTQPGMGSSFTIFLPLTETAPASTVCESAHLAPVGGDETILLVEDDADVRSLLGEWLTNCGYVVLEAATGDEALEVVIRHAARIHLVVADVVMPGMSGPGLAGRLRTEIPGVQVLFISGYVDDMIVKYKGLGLGDEIMCKPFTAQALLRRVREVLDRRNETDAA